jgi:cell division protein FtsB
MTLSSKPGALSLGLSTLILYLALNAVTGRQGLIEYVKLQAQERELLAERADLAEQSAALKARIHALADSSLDVDALEEIARREIGAARHDELVFDIAQSDTSKTQ